MPETKSASFFRRKLTHRHFLTRRIIPSLLLAVAVLVAGLFVFLPKPSGSVEAASELNEAALTDAASNDSAGKVRLLKVLTRQLNAAGPASIEQDFTGIVMARRSSQLSAKTVGRVVTVNVDLGDMVSAGEKLVELDHEQIDAQRDVTQASLLAAEAQLSELEKGPRDQDIEQAEERVKELQSTLQLREANFRRTKNLLDSSAISLQEFDESRFSLDATRAQLAAAQQSLALLREGTRSEQIAAQRANVAGLQAQLRKLAADRDDQDILAPFDGLVHRRSVDEGVVVSPGQPLIDLVEVAPYEVRVGLPAELASGLTVSNLRVTCDDQLLAAKIARMAPTINESTRTREVVLEVSEASSRLVTLGSSVTVSVKTPVRSKGFWVPTRALTAGERGLWAVFIAVPEFQDTSTRGSAAASSDGLENEATSLIERRQVELLRSNGAWTEVQGPLSPHERLVVRGVHRITPGQRVIWTEENELDDQQRGSR